MANYRAVGQQSYSLDRPVRIGILGFGTVGAGTYQMLADNQEEILAKGGLPFEVVKVAVRDRQKPRALPESLLTFDPNEVISDPSIDVVLELIGGEEPAYELVKLALAAGKHVVTANKELIAKHGLELIQFARDRGLDLHFEAAVGGGIPLVQPLKHQLAGNDVLKMMGILNGTSNYILTQMAQANKSFADALKEAQAEGFAEADPTNDVDGFDAMYKISILGSIVFNKQVPIATIHREGIRKVSLDDMQHAERLGYRIKLLAISEEVEGVGVRTRVHPALLPIAHPLAGIDGVYNALWLDGDYVGDVMFAGRGAGAAPTASAVVGDFIDVLRNLAIGGAGSAIPFGSGLPTLSMEDLVTRYYVRLRVVDKPRSLSMISGAFGDAGVGLTDMDMRVLAPEVGEIVFMTHPCREAEMLAAVRELEALEVVHSVESLLRVEEPTS